MRATFYAARHIIRLRLCKVQHFLPIFVTFASFVAVPNLFVAVHVYIPWYNFGLQMASDDLSLCISYTPGCNPSQSNKLLIFCIGMNELLLLNFHDILGIGYPSTAQFSLTW